MKIPAEDEQELRAAAKHASPRAAAAVFEVLRNAYALGYKHGYGLHVEAELAESDERNEG